MIRRAVLFALLAGLIVLAVVYYMFDPSDSVFFPKCVFRVVTGWECPGCGSQRAIHALLHGDLGKAWSHNAGLLVAIPILLTLVVAEWNRLRWPRFHQRVTSTPLITLLLLAIMLWWIGRNLI